jgi:hypothetical protein
VSSAIRETGREFIPDHIEIRETQTVDISDMIAEGKTPEPVGDHKVINLDTPPPHDDRQSDIEFPDSATPAAVDDGPEMTAVDRIKAYRDGSLALPMVGRLDNDDEQSEVDEGDDEDDRAVEPDNDGDANTDDRSDVEGDADTASGNATNFLTGFPGLQAGRLPRKAWMIGGPVLVALVAAGVVLPGLGHQQSDPNSPPAAATQGSSAGRSTTTRSSPVDIPNAVIKPVSADGPEYPISVTKPMDAFSGDKGKGWVCSGLYGTVLSITLPGPTAISEIDLLPGLVGTDADGSPLWAQHLLVAKVAFGFDYGDPVYADYADYADKQQMQPTTFRNVISKVITITVLELKDISGKGPGAGSAAPSASSSPGILGDLGALKLDPAAPSSPASPSGGGSRPPTFAIGAIQIMGHTPN